MLYHLLALLTFLIVLEHINSLSCVSFGYGDLRQKFSFFSCDIVTCVLVNYYIFVVDVNVMIFYSLCCFISGGKIYYYYCH